MRASSMLSKRRRLDTLLLVHSATAAVGAALAVALPHVMEAVLIPHADDGGLRGANDGDKVAHLLMRLYGILLGAQAWMVWSARRIRSPQARRAVVQACFGCLAATTLALARAALTPGGHFLWLLWLNIACFAALSGLYGWFVFVQPVTAFQLPGSAAD